LAPCLGLAADRGAVRTAIASRRPPAAQPPLLQCRDSRSRRRQHLRQGAWQPSRAPASGV